MVLEALAAVVGADGGAGARWEPRLSPAVLQLWAQHVKDPLLSMDAVAVIEGLASIPAALPSLQVPAFPLLDPHQLLNYPACQQNTIPGRNIMPSWTTCAKLMQDGTTLQRLHLTTCIELLCAPGRRHSAQLLYVAVIERRAMTKALREAGLSCHPCFIKLGCLCV